MEHIHLSLDDAEAQFFASQRARNHSPRTITRYQQTFADFRRFITETGRPADTSVLTHQDCQAFLAWLHVTPRRLPWRGSTERSIFGINGRLQDMRAFVRWLYEAELLDRPVKVALPKLPETMFPILSDAQLETLFSCRHLTAKGVQALRNRALISLMLDTGLRLNEVATAQLADLDLKDQLLKVRGKGSKDRRVPFSSGVAEALQAWLEVRGEEPGEIFWLTRNGIQTLFVRIRKETGLPISPHVLRHQAATMMVRHNADLHTVRRILGHSDLSVTERYMSLSYQDLRAKHAAASPFEKFQQQLPQLTKPKRKRLHL